MNTIRKLIYRPKKSDTSYLAQFYYADEQLNLIATELDSFDGRKDPERCTALVSQLRHSQDEVLAIIEKIMLSAVPERSRAARDYRVKFPDDVLHDSLAGQLWFGAECLAAGSSIMNREVESASMRPLAKSLTRHLDSLRSLLREQCLRNQNVYTEKIYESLIEFDKISAEFELSYVSAMVPVKTMREYDLLQDVTVLFCETVERALRLNLLSQDMLDAYEPALMFTIPRLAIVCGLLIYPEGPINPDMDPLNMCEMFRPFQTLLYKIRELLWTLNDAELHTLETALCTTVEESEQPSALLANLSASELVTDSTDSRGLSDDTYFDDSSDTEPSTSMVHSESTMTVVAARNFTSDVDSDKVDASSANSVPPTIPDIEARHLQHSLSWPQPADNQRNATSTAGDSPASSASSSAIALCGAREFILTLPCNTSVERLSSGTQPNHSVMNATNEGGIIYLSSSGAVTSSNGPRQQITFVTDEFCRLFGADVGADISDEGETLHDIDGNSERLMSSLIQDGVRELARQHDADESRTQPTCSSQSRGTSNSNDISQSISSAQRFAVPVCNSHDVLCCVSGTANVETKDANSTCGLPPTRVTVKSGVTTSLHCRNTNNTADAVKLKSGRRVRRSGFPRSLAQSWSGVDVTSLRSAAASTAPGYSNIEIGWDHDSCCSSDTSSYSSESRDDEEIALAIQAAEATARQEARSRFKSAADLIHRLFVCISGVADQLQTNYATDLRHILKAVFECNTSEAVAELDAAEDSSPTMDSDISVNHENTRQASVDVLTDRRSRARDPPSWVPDTESDVCMACHSAFTFVKRRHHCRNCGKLFCSPCSSNAVPLPHYGHEKPVRVCNHCFVYHVTPFTMNTARTVSNEQMSSAQVH